MTAASFIATQQSAPNADPQGRNRPCHSALAHNCLQRVSSTGEWAHALGVSERQIRKWIAHEVALPALRVSQILFTAKRLLMQFDALEHAIDELLIEQYGPQGARGGM